MTQLNESNFLRDVAEHKMHVIRDDGVNRHIRFKKEGTTCMHFDLITWPGYLCYTGDMGTFVFRRITDMFEFFRADKSDNLYRIDFRYWAEKVEAANKDGGLEAFSAEKFKTAVRDYFEQATGEWTGERKAALWSEIESDVIDRVEDDGEGGAWVALRDFSHDGFVFSDWENNCKEYSHSFLWCCYALAWGIKTYDEASATVSGVAA